MGRLSRFAPRVQWSGVSAEFSSPSRIPSVLLPQRQHFPRFSAVVELLFRRILAMGFLDGIASPVPFHNGSNFRISLPLRNGFSAASLLWASWTALSPQSPSTTALITAFSCRCGKDRRAHLPKVIRILPDLARLRKVERGGWKRKRGHRRYRGPREIAHLRKVSRKRGKTAHLRKVGEGGWKRKRGHRRYRGPREIAHLRKVSKKRGKTAHLWKVGEGGWKRKRGHRRYRGPREIAHLRKVSRNAEKHDSFRRSEEVSGKLWSEGDAKGWTGPKREGGGVCRKPMPGLREPPVKRISL